MKIGITISYIKNDNGTYHAWINEYPGITSVGEDIDDIEKILLARLKLTLDMFTTLMNKGALQIDRRDITKQIKAVEKLKKQEEEEKETKQ
jgi:predicted RNase H-like HicB family nuclease